MLAASADISGDVMRSSPQKMSSLPDIDIVPENIKKD